MLRGRANKTSRVRLSSPETDRRDIMDDHSIDSPQAIMEMRRRHLRLALEMQQLAVRGLTELRERGDLTAEECTELLAAGMALERGAKPH